MRPAYVVDIQTPKKLLLKGLWFGPEKPKRAIVWIHGLTSSAFSGHAIVEKLVDADMAVLTFNNRGHDNVARIRKLHSKKSITAGAAYERFEDCVDDIQGAIDFARGQGAKDIYLAGHSTGCQKAAYWAYKNATKKNTRVRGLVLLAPMSDYAGMLKKYGMAKMRAMSATARAMLKSGRGGEIIRSRFWQDEPNSPQRFLSLYTPDSVEQSIFSYFDPERPAKYLRNLRVPILAFLAEHDEYADRPQSEIAQWFMTAKSRDMRVEIVRDAGHGFGEKEKEVADLVRGWIATKK